MPNAFIIYRGGASIRAFNPGLTDHGVFEYLAIAGGGIGGHASGGGGAGGYVTASDYAITRGAYTITVGGGGGGVGGYGNVDSRGGYGGSSTIVGNLGIGTVVTAYYGGSGEAAAHLMATVVVLVAAQVVAVPQVPAAERQYGPRELRWWRHDRRWLWRWWWRYWH